MMDLSKWKAFADDNLNVAEIKIFVCDKEENIVRKGEIADYQHFLLFAQCFQKASFLWFIKLKIMLSTVTVAQMIIFV